LEAAVIVITAPTGNIGHVLLDLVLASGQPVRVIARHPGKLPAAAQRQAEVFTGSHGDPAVLDQALAGADSLFWLPTSDPAAASVDDAIVGFSRPAIEAITRLGVKRVVSVSALGRGTPVAAHAGHVTASLAMDDLIAATGVAFRALTMPTFMDNLLRQLTPIREQGAFFNVVSPDRRQATVATRDIAAVAARLLLDGSWTGQAEVPVLGPEDLCPDDEAAIMSEVLGRPIRYLRIPDQALKDQLTSSGVSAAMAQALLDMADAKEHGLDEGITRTPQNAIDTPTTFREWCEDTLKPAVLGH
jgi:uncharacterized protein YbjT (DUF2867 family)